jgi:hypothetical protein
LPTDLPGALAGLGTDGGFGTLNFDGGIPNVGSMVTQQMGGSGAGTQGLLSMVMGFVYPFIKPMMEASIRRVTVTVRWHEGVKPKEFSILQYVTNPSNGGFGPAASGSASAGSTPGAAGASTSAGASTAAVNAAAPGVGR